MASSSCIRSSGAHRSPTSGEHSLNTPAHPSFVVPVQIVVVCCRAFSRLVIPEAPVRVVAVTRHEPGVSSQLEHLLSEGRVTVEERNDDVGGEARWSLVTASEAGTSHGECLPSRLANCSFNCFLSSASLGFSAFIGDCWRLQSATETAFDALQSTSVVNGRSMTDLDLPLLPASHRTRDRSMTSLVSRSASERRNT